MRSSSPGYTRDARTIQFISIAALVLLLSHSSAGSPGDAVRVLVIGDSLSTQGGRYVIGAESGNSFADQLEIDLDDGFEFINIACPGSSAIDWSIRTPGALCPPFPWYEFPNGLFKERALPELPVDIALVLLGTNDAAGILEPQSVEPDAYDEAIAEIVDALLAGGVKQVILSTPPDVKKSWTHRRLQAYREKILDRCKLPGQPVCGPDFFSLLDLETDFENRNIHPNARGHARMAKALRESILAVSPHSNDRTYVVAAGLIALTILISLWVVRRQRSVSALRRTPERKSLPHSEDP